MTDENNIEKSNNMSNEDTENINNLSIAQINELFSDIIELPEDYFIAAASTSSKSCHNSRC